MKEKTIVIVLTLILCLLFVGCSSNIYYVKRLQAPQWDVDDARRIGIVAVIGKGGARYKMLTRALTEMLTERLSHSPFYEEVKQYEYKGDRFKKSGGKYRLIADDEIKRTGEELSVARLMLIEALDESIDIGLDGARFSIGFGATTDHWGAFAHIPHQSYWTVQGKMSVQFSYINCKEAKLLGTKLITKEFYKTGSHNMPSESSVREILVREVTDHIATFVDVFYKRSPRELIMSDIKLVNRGVAIARDHKRQSLLDALVLWDTAALQFPDSYAARYNAGVALELLGKYEEAARRYRQAAERAARHELFTREIKESEHSAAVLEKYGARR